MSPLKPIGTGSLFAALLLISGCGKGSMPMPDNDVASHDVDFPNGHEIDLGNPSAYKPMEKGLDHPSAPLLKAGKVPAPPIKKRAEGTIEKN